MSLPSLAEKKEGICGNIEIYAGVTDAEWQEYL